MNGDAIRLAVFASGGGSNFQSIINAVEAGSLEIELALAVSNRSTAGALERAARHGIPTLTLDPKSFAKEEDYATELLAELDRHRVNFIALAGYLRKIPSVVVQRFRGRMLNIHPALLPAFGGKGFYGRKVHVAVLEHGAQWTGATVHLVDEEYDTGPIVLQMPVPVRSDDTPESLAARVLEAEHALYPEALRLFASGRISFVGRRAIIVEESG